MGKAGKTVLILGLGIVGLIGILVVAAGYEAAQFSLNQNDFLQMVAVTADVCDSKDHICEGKMLMRYAQCYPPFLNTTESSGCIHRVFADLNKKFHPELEQPNYSQEQVSSWVKTAARNIFRFSYSDLENNFYPASIKYFTPNGWLNFMNALTDTHILEVVKARKLVVDLIVNGDPQVKKTYTEDNVYTWEIEFPVTIQFKRVPGLNDGREVPDPIKILLFLKIARSSLSSDGVGIAQWVTLPANGS